MKAIASICLSLSTIIMVVSNNNHHASATGDYLSTDSDLGKMVLSEARRLGDGNDDDNSVNYNWMARFSLKFQGCHNIQQWNENADEDGSDVKIQTARIARFRLCPSRTCSSRKSKGCTKGYGDYIVDINTYVSAYIEAQRRQDEYACQMYVYKKCDCQNTDDADLCEYKCYMKARKYDCIDQNPYYDDDANVQGLYRNDLRDFQKYFSECTQFEVDYDERRRLKGDDDNDIVYYIGSYCADQGGKVYLGMFTDSLCTMFADSNAGRSTYKSLTGQDLPFSDYSMVRTECISCLETNRHKDQWSDDYFGKSEMRINNECQQVYQAAGKCETEMTKYGPQTINSNACYFIDGIKIVRKDGFLDTNFTRPDKTTSFFIFFFAVSFVLLGAYIYYLRMSEFINMHDL